MKRIRKPIAVILGLAMILSLVPMMAFAEENGNDDYIRRIAGVDRHDTARRIAEEAFGTSDNVVVARSDTGWDDGHEQFPDALAGSLLAQSKDAPLLLTKKDSLHPQTEQAINDLGASKVYILGGPAAVSEDVEAEILALAGVNEVERVFGANRFETAVQIAEAGDKYDNGGYGTAFIANGHKSADAMIAGAKAFESGLPIFLVREDEIPSGNSTSTYEALNDPAMGIDNVIIVGGTAVIDESVEEELEDIFGADNVDRLAGPGRIQTATEFAKDQFEDPLQFSIVNGHTGLADAVTGSVFGDPILYSSRDGDELTDDVLEYLTELFGFEWDAGEAALLAEAGPPEGLLFTLLGGPVRLTDGLIDFIRTFIEGLGVGDPASFVIEASYDNPFQVEIKDIQDRIGNEIAWADIVDDVDATSSAVIFANNEDLDAADSTTTITFDDFGLVPDSTSSVCLTDLDDWGVDFGEDNGQVYVFGRIVAADESWDVTSAPFDLVAANYIDQMTPKVDEAFAMEDATTSEIGIQFTVPVKELWVDGDAVTDSTSTAMLETFNVTVDGEDATTTAVTLVEDPEVFGYPVLQLTLDQPVDTVEGEVKVTYEAADDYYVAGYVGLNLEDFTDEPVEGVVVLPGQSAVEPRPHGFWLE